MTINEIIFEMLNNQDSTPSNSNINKKFSKSDVNINSSLSPNYKTSPLIAKKTETRADKIHGVTNLDGNKKL